MQVRLWTVALIGIMASDAMAQRAGECAHEAERNATIDVAGARMLMLEAGSGSLKVEGRPGQNRVVVRGRACASSAGLLERVTLNARRSGDHVVIRANVEPERHSDFRNNEYARLDIVVEVPEGMNAEIDDGSGTIELSNLGSVRIEDGSGDIVANNLRGDVEIDDGSGSIHLVDVTGRVNIDDGSGEIELQNIGGLVDIDDGSGEITIRGARNSVHVLDASGDIDVRDVGGDFVVADDGSGSIDYDNVRGRVDVPRRKR